MINFFFGDTQVNVQFIPVYGISAGILYYDPSLEPDTEYDEENFYRQITLMFFLFGVHITIL